MSFPGPARLPDPVPDKRPGKPPLLTWIIAGTVLVLVSLAARLGREPLDVLAGLASVAATLPALLWAVFHPRSLQRAPRAASRWAVWLTLFFVVGLLSALDQVSGAYPAFRPPTALVAVGLILGTPLWWSAFFLLGLLGGAIGAFWGRCRLEDADSCVLGVSLFWCLTFPAGVAMIRLQGSLPLVPGLLLSVAPAGTALGSRLLAGRKICPTEAAGRALRLLRRPRADLRGVGLGLFAGLLLVAIARVGLLAPAQRSALVSLVQLRGDLVDAVGQFRFDPKQNAPEDRITILEMDAAAYRAALVTHSEAWLQARMIRALTRWKPRGIVLPAPRAADPGMPGDFGISTVAAGCPRLSTTAVRRTIADLPALESAVRAAGNVVLTAAPEGVPPGVRRPDLPELLPWLHPDARRGMQQLRLSAAAWGWGDFGSLGSPRLPTIPTEGTAHPAPVVLLSHWLESGGRAGKRATPSRRAMDGLPLAAPGQVLIDFPTREPRSLFPHLTYSSVLGSEGRDDAEPQLPVFGIPNATPSWQRASDYFRGRIVLLDRVERQVRPTPIGELPTNDVLAFAIDTVEYGSAMHRLPEGIAVALLLATAVIVGALCVGRPPFAGIRVALIAILCWGLIAMVACLAQAWVDPLAPSAAAAGALLLVSEFTYTQEREQRERNRALLERFVSPTVVDQLLEEFDQFSLGGVRQEVCVLFADIRSFTPFTERNMPEEVIDLTNRYLTAMTDALWGEEGILDKYTGDGLMAFFRVTGSRQSTVEQAVRAAVAMQAAAVAVSSQLRKEGREALSIGIGLHVGEAIVGLVGHLRHVNYTAFGYTVVVSQRLQSLAEGGQILLSAQAYDQVRSIVVAEPWSSVEVKGLSRPVQPYLLIGLRELPEAPATQQEPKSSGSHSPSP